MANLQGFENGCHDFQELKMDRRLTLSPPERVLFSRVNSTQGDQQGSQHPPIEIVVVKGISPPSASASKPSLSKSQLQSARSLSSSMMTIDHVLSPTAPYKLKPRNPINFSAKRSNRGRKRPATYISSAGFLSSAAPDDSDNKREEVTKEEAGKAISFTVNGSLSSTPRNDCVANAVATLQSLSLSSSSPAVDRGPSSSLGESPMLGTQQPRPNAVGSCFSKYNSSSPSRPLLHRPPQQQFPRFPSRLSSPAGSTRSASPKIASLTVLSHSGSRTGCGVMEDSPAAIILPPPMMESVVTAVGSKSWIPPLSIHCSIKSETSSNSSFSTINAQDEEDHEDTAAFRSTGVASRPVRASCEDSPNRSVSGMLDRTPLPTIALTPRSHASRKDHLPQFPSPNSDDEFTSPFFETPQSATLLSTTCTNSREVNMDSFDFGPKPALLSPQRLFAVEHPAGGDMADGDKSTSVPSMSHEFGPSRAAPTCSLMKPSTSHNSMLGLFEDAARRLPDSFDDTGSLSASDDEDDFLLVPPSVTTGACLGDNHPAKHRRFVHLSSTEEFGKSLSSFPSLNSRHESSNSLYGAGLLNSASANSLSGMDYDTLRAAGSNSCRFARREESSSSLERINDGDRDLVTPPLMQQATSPPPLSHRSGEISARCS